LDLKTVGKNGVHFSCAIQSQTELGIAPVFWEEKDSKQLELA